MFYSNKLVTMTPYQGRQISDFLMDEQVTVVSVLI